MTFLNLNLKKQEVCPQQILCFRDTLPILFCVVPNQGAMIFFCCEYTIQYSICIEERPSCVLLYYSSNPCLQVEHNPTLGTRRKFSHMCLGTQHTPWMYKIICRIQDRRTLYMSHGIVLCFLSSKQKSFCIQCVTNFFHKYL